MLSTAKKMYRELLENGVRIRKIYKKKEKRKGNIEEG